MDRLARKARPRGIAPQWIRVRTLANTLHIKNMKCVVDTNHCSQTPRPEQVLRLAETQHSTTQDRTGHHSTCTAQHSTAHVTCALAGRGRESDPLSVDDVGFLVSSNSSMLIVSSSSSQSGLNVSLNEHTHTRTHAHACTHAHTHRRGNRISTRPSISIHGTCHYSTSPPVA